MGVKGRTAPATSVLPFTPLPSPARAKRPNAVPSIRRAISAPTPPPPLHRHPPDDLGRSGNSHGAMGDGSTRARRDGCRRGGDRQDDAELRAALRPIPRADLAAVGLHGLA